MRRPGPQGGLDRRPGDAAAPGIPRRPGPAQFTGFKVLDYLPDSRDRRRSRSGSTSAQGRRAAGHACPGTDEDWKGVLQTDGSFNGEAEPDVLQSLRGLRPLRGPDDLVSAVRWRAWDWGDCVRRVPGEAVEVGASAALFKLILDAIKFVVIKAVEAVMKAVGFLWIYIAAPDIQNNERGRAGCHSRTTYLMITAAIAIIVGAIQMAVSQRGEPLRDIIKSHAHDGRGDRRPAVSLRRLIDYADEFSEWIIERGARDGRPRLPRRAHAPDGQPARGSGRALGCRGDLLSAS